MRRCSRDGYDHIVIASQYGLPAISAQLRESGLVDKQDFFSIGFVENLGPLLRLARQDA